MIHTRVTGNFKPLRDGIAVADMNFGETRTESGLIIASDDGKVGGVHPRWAEVTHIGPARRCSNWAMDNGSTWSLESWV